MPADVLKSVPSAELAVVPADWAVGGGKTGPTHRGSAWQSVHGVDARALRGPPGESTPTARPHPGRRAAPMSGGAKIQILLTAHLRP